MAGKGGTITSNNLSNNNIGIYEDGVVTITQNTISSPANGIGINMLPTSAQLVTVLNNLISGGANSINVDASAEAIDAEIHFNSLTGASSSTIINQSA